MGMMGHVKDIHLRCGSPVTNLVARIAVIRGHRMTIAYHMMWILEIRGEFRRGNHLGDYPPRLISKQKCGDGERIIDDAQHPSSHAILKPPITANHTQNTTTTDSVMKMATPSVRWGWPRNLTKRQILEQVLTS
ncbi:hypothetical protein ACTXT7_017152 [Hymenolepis weldensis]